MATEQSEQMWSPVCYSCPARISHNNEHICDETQFIIFQAKGFENKRPLNCPKNRGLKPQTPFTAEDLLRAKLNYR